MGDQKSGLGLSASGAFFAIRAAPAMDKDGGGGAVFEHRQYGADLCFGGRNEPGHRDIDILHAGANNDTLFLFRPVTRFAQIDDPSVLEAALRKRAGVVETGLFLGAAQLALVGYADRVERIEGISR